MAMLPPTADIPWTRQYTPSYFALIERKLWWTPKVHAEGVHEQLIVEGRLWWTPKVHAEGVHEQLIVEGRLWWTLEVQLYKQRECMNNARIGNE